MGTIKAITDCDGHNQHHYCEAQNFSQDKRPPNATRRAMAKPQGGLADKCNKGVVRTSWVSRQYSSCNDNHCQRKVDCRNASATSTTTRRSSKKETSGRLGIFMPQISHNKKRTSRTTKKHTIKNLQWNYKKCSHVTLMPRVMCATLAEWAMHTIDWRHPKRQQNKHTLRRQQRRQKLPSSFW